MEWSIVIFCYNEEENIGNVISHTIDFLKLPSNNNSEIIVVNDGSTDNTASVIQTFKNQYPHINIHELSKNQGIGNALNIGYNLASRDYICAIPGDGQFDIRELRMVNEFSSNEFITFYRTSKNYNLYRNLLTNFNQLFNKWILKIDVPDVNWIKVYKKVQLLNFQRQLNSSLVESEICAKLIKSGCTHIDIPSKYLERKYGEAKGGNWRTLKKAISEMLKLVIIVKKFNPQQ